MNSTDAMSEIRQKPAALIGGPMHGACMQGRGCRLRVIIPAERHLDWPDLAHTTDYEAEYVWLTFGPLDLYGAYWRWHGMKKVEADKAALALMLAQAFTAEAK